MPKRKMPERTAEMRGLSDATLGRLVEHHWNTFIAYQREQRARRQERAQAAKQNPPPEPSKPATETRGAGEPAAATRGVDAGASHQNPQQ